MPTTTELPPIQTWKRRADDQEETALRLDRLAAQGSIRRKKREGIVARVRRRMGWR